MSSAAGTPATTPNYQSIILQCFTQLLAKSKQNHEEAIMLQSSCASSHLFRIRVFKNIIQDLKTHFGPPHGLHDVNQQLKGRKGYGKGTMKRIREIVNTGTLLELQPDVVTADPSAADLSAADPSATDLSAADPSARLTVLRSLLAITGIGPVKANALAAHNITREQLKAWCASEEQYTEELANAKLTHHQRLGVKYDDDLQHRIPRGVIDQVNTMIHRMVTEATRSPICPDTATICGSYRRGQPDSGDVDVLMTHSEWTSSKQVTAGLREMLTQLHHTGWVVDDLTDRQKTKTKYMGFMRVPGHPWALRVDIRAVTRSQYVPALAYFTGSKEENVRLRGLALTKQMRLNEYALVSEPDGTPHELHSEEELYATLDVPYKSPTQR